MYSVSLQRLPSQRTIHWLASNHTNAFFHSLEARSSRSRCQQGWFLPRPLLSLACRWPSSCVFRDHPSVYFYVTIASLFKDANPSFYLSFLFKSPVSKSNHSLGVRASTCEFGANTILVSMRFLSKLQYKESRTINSCQGNLGKLHGRENIYS